MNLNLKIIVLMTTMVLFSCGSTTKKAGIPELKPLQVIHFSKPELNCLGAPLKQVVIDRILNCEGRLDTIQGQIKAYNNK